MFEKSNATLEKLGAVITTREIQQEPKLWLETLAICQQHQAKLADLLASFELKENQKIRVIFTGAGTSQYVGDTLVPYLRRTGDTNRFEFVSLGTTDIVAAPKDYLLADEPTSGIKTTKLFASAFLVTAKAPSAAQVITKCLTCLTTLFASFTVALLSGLLPLRAKDTSKVGSSAKR